MDLSDLQVKKCTKCDKTKVVGEFRLCRLHKGSTNGEYTRSECVACEKEQSKNYRQARKDAHPKPPNCECCGKAEEKLVVDHCHDTGAFRGWICRNCNTGLGKLGDNLGGILTALIYLRKASS